MEIAIIIIAAGVILAILTAGFAGFVYILKVLGEGIANIFGDIANIFGERNKENADKSRLSDTTSKNNFSDKSRLSDTTSKNNFSAVQFSKFIDDIKKRDLDSDDLVLLAFIILFIICMIVMIFV